MSDHPISFKSFGEQAILIEWPALVEETILYDILVFTEYLRTECLNTEVWEFVPAYNSLTLICRHQIDNPSELMNQLSSWHSKTKGHLPLKRQLWRLPVCYEEEFGIDLEEVAEKLGLSPAQLIEMHTSEIYTVYGIGFLPGFMYLGGLPQNLEVPRRASPRLKVPEGSVGLAGKQTGIYPQESPGGWNIIGNCPIPIFNIDKSEPCFVRIGDRIQFYPINRAAYDLHKIEAEVGIYNIEKTVVDV